MRPDFRPLDLPMLILMMEAIVDGTDRLDPQLWERYLSLLLAGMRSDQVAASPLPGQPLDVERTQQALANRRKRH